MTRATTAWVLAGVVLGVASVGAGNPSAEDRAAFAYEQGFEASGSFQGSCEVAGFRLAEGIHETLTFASQDMRLVVVRTWENMTVVRAGPIPAGVGRTVEQRLENVSIPSGSFSIEWNQHGHAFLTRAAFGWRGNLTVDLEGARWTSGPPDEFLRVGPNQYFESARGAMIKVPPNLPGPARWLRTDQTTVHLHGDGFFKMDEANVTGPSFRLELPPYFQLFKSQETPISYHASALYTYAVLDARGLNLTLPFAFGDLGCMGLDWQGSGAVTYRLATGSLSRGNESKPFAGRELTVNGNLVARDIPVRIEEPWGHAYRNQANTTGAFSAVGLEYVEAKLPAARASLPVVVQASAVAAFLAAFLAWKGKSLWSLFTRLLKGDPLENPVRALLHNAARERPGSILADVVRESGQAYSTVRHHANRLARLGMIALYDFDRQVHLYPPKTTRREAVRLLAHHEPVVAAADYLNGGAHSESDVRVMLKARYGKPHYWISRVLDRAVRWRIIERQETNQGVILRAVK